MRYLRGLLVGLLVAVCLPGVAVAQQRTISVTGEASLSAANDSARISFGARATARSRGAALRITSRRLRAVLGVLRAQGVAARDLRTGAITVVRVSTKTRRGRIVRYEGRSGVRAVLRPASRAGTAVGAVTSAGGFTSAGPTYFVSNGAELRRRALVAAFGDARAKAAALAAQAGLTLGPPIAIRESGSAGFTRESVSEDGSGEGRRRVSRPTTVPTQAGTTRIAGAVDVVFAAG